MYLVGSLSGPDDGEYEDEDAAIDFAIALSYSDHSIGVWWSEDLAHEDRELIAIVYGQRVYRLEE